MRKLLPLILVSLLVLSIMPAAGQEDVIVMWASYDLTDEENAPSVTLKNTIEAFEEATGITVEYEQVAWDQLSTKLALQSQSGGEMPDVVETSSQHILPLINTGALMDISDMVTEFEWAETLSEAENRACVVGEERFCVAADVRGGAWFYNVDDFPNGWPTTTEGLLEEGARLKEEDKYVVTFYAGDHYASVEALYAPLAWSAGGIIFDEDGLPAWADEPMVKAIEWVREMLANEYIPPDLPIRDFTGAETPWVEGEAAAVRGGSWSYLFIPGLQEAIESGATTLGLAPSIEDGPNYVFMVGEGWAVTNGADNPEAAMAWIDFFMTPDTLAEWASNHYGIPTIEEAFDNEAFDNEFYQMNAENLSDNGRFLAPSTCYVEALTKLSTTLQELLLNPDMEALPTLEEAQEEVSRRCDPLYEE